MSIAHKIIETKELPLSNSENRSLWVFPIFSFIFAIMPLLAGAEMIYFSVFLFGLCAFLTYRALVGKKMTIVYSNSSVETKEKIVNDLIEQYDWKLIDKKERYYKFHERFLISNHHFITVVLTTDAFYLHITVENMKGGIFSSLTETLKVKNRVKELLNEYGELHSSAINAG